MNFIRLLLIGIVIGMANVIPGVSGGTLAVVFNIYDKFVNAITLNVKKIIVQIIVRDAHYYCIWMTGKWKTIIRFHNFIVYVILY